MRELSLIAQENVAFLASKLYDFMPEILSWAECTVIAMSLVTKPVGTSVVRFVDGVQYRFWVENPSMGTANIKVAREYFGVDSRNWEALK